MIRPVTLLCAFLAASSGLFLYTKKHETLVLEQNITHIIKDTRKIQEQTAMLRTQWALLNQPDRLSALSARILPKLHTVDPSQFVKLAQLESRLPRTNEENTVVASVTRQDTSKLSPVSMHATPRNAALTHNNKATHRVIRTAANTSHAVSSFERNLALLNAEDRTPTPLQHQQHSSIARNDHTSAEIPTKHSSASQVETIAWHPQTSHHAPVSHRNNAQPSASSDDVLPPPVPFSH